jgi:hypothetical protein
MSRFSVALIDVRLRKQIYDQGGLALLSLLKDRNRQLPVLVLTAYSYDYPGLREVTERYPFVYTYDKEVFEKQPGKILDVLFAELPPQIGDHGSSQKIPVATLPVPGSLGGANRTGLPWREVAAGALFVTLVLAAALLFFLLSRRFADFARQLDILFAVMIVAMIAVLLRIFKPALVRRAVAIFKELLGTGAVGSRSKPPAHPDSRAKRGSQESDEEPNSSKRQA